MWAINTAFGSFCIFLLELKKSEPVRNSGSVVYFKPEQTG